LSCFDGKPAEKTLGFAQTMLMSCGWSIVCLLFCVIQAGCGGHTRKKPEIEFTRVPPAAEGGPDKLDTLEGRVSGARPGQRIVVYAKAGTVWWVQPLDSRPYTIIESDGTWKTATHLGTEYGAILVDPGYQPALTLKALPQDGGLVPAVNSVSPGPGPVLVDQKLNFSGYQWLIRHIASDRNGAVSYYDPANASVDADGNLHLRISREKEHSVCSQVALTSHLGYGTYLFTTKDTSQLESAAVLTMLTYDELAAEHHREMDIEVSRWGDPKNRNGDYVVQPYYFPENKILFEIPSGKMTHSFHWEAGKATFETAHAAGKGSKAGIVARNVFTTGIPSPGSEVAVIDFCDFKFSKVPLQNGAEVVIEKFQYLP
jgi:hypothetical protein